MKPRTRGFTLFELVVVISIIGVLAAVLLNRLWFYQEKAEQVAMQSTLQAVKTGLQIRLAELIITYRQQEAARLEVENPTQWLSILPTDYAGDYRKPLQPGAWYYDSARRQLVYVPRNNNHLEVAAEDGVKQLRFEVKLIKYQSVIYGSRVESVEGVRLVAVYPYRWL
ncbi:MAG: prepilin-type N-terminal cleavage/methylation domain-containing protein [Burkholderiales bacterium]|nr:prepilin-type N-terminal cleavage/methylation domain-containing protein [Burkholderiales bacterium]